MSNLSQCIQMLRNPLPTHLPEPSVASHVHMPSTARDLTSHLRHRRRHLHASRDAPGDALFEKSSYMNSSVCVNTTNKSLYGGEKGVVCCGKAIHCEGNREPLGRSSDHCEDEFKDASNISSLRANTVTYRATLKAISM